jgi:hypothetical protein
MSAIVQRPRFPSRGGRLAGIGGPLARVAFAQAAFATALCVSCGAGRGPAPFLPGDLIPPGLESISATGESLVMLEFTEAVRAPGEGPTLWGPQGLAVPIASMSAEGEALRVETAAALIPGAEYRLEGRVEDQAGNSLGFILAFNGLNPRPSSMLINEVRTDSSAPRSDLIELYVTGSGLCAGHALVSGSVEDPDWVYRLPACETASGEYLIVHLATPEGESYPDELGADLALSAGPDSSGSARDLWLPEKATLSKSNGIIVLIGPDGAAMDALAYSDKVSEAGAPYDGFGTKAFQARVLALAGSGAWKAGSPPKPEDLASSRGVTSTRTLCRSSMSADTDRAADWHVVPTKGQSFGSANSDGAYVPGPAAARIKR